MLDSDYADPRDPIPSPTTPSTLPCWGKVSQMGHRSHLGYVELSLDLGTPMLRITTPAVPGDAERKPSDGAVNFASPASLYGFAVFTEAEVLAALLDGRGYRPREWPRLAADEAVEVAALPRTIISSLDDEDDTDPDSAPI